MRLALLVMLLLVLSAATYSGDFVQGTQTCPASGRIQVSSTSYNLFQLSITANLDNSGKIYIGGVTVTTANAPGLPAGWSYNAGKPSSGVNPAALYFACDSSSDGLKWIGSR